MRTNARIFFHARVLMAGVGGLLVLLAGAWIMRGEVHGSWVGPAAAGAVAIVVLLATCWLGWIDLVSALSLSIDDRALSIGWPTRRELPWREITSVQRSLGTLRLVLKTKSSPVRIQLLVDATPPKTLAKLVGAVRAAGGNVEEYLVKLAEYVEETPDLE